MNRRKLSAIILLLILIIIIYTTNNPQELETKNNSVYIGGLAWETSLDYGISLAEKENKFIFIYFWADWCQFCRKFENEVLSNPEVSKMLKENFILVSINFDEDKNTSKKFGVYFPPYGIFLDKKGNVLGKITGYIPPDDFISAIKKINAQKSNLKR